MRLHKKKTEIQLQQQRVIPMMIGGLPDRGLRAWVSDVIRCMEWHKQQIDRSVSSITQGSPGEGPRRGDSREHPIEIE